MRGEGSIPSRATNKFVEMITNQDLTEFQSWLDVNYREEKKQHWNNREWIGKKYQEYQSSIVYNCICGLGQKEPGEHYCQNCLNENPLLIA